MNKIFSKITFKSVVLGSVFSRYKQQLRHKTGNELNVQFLTTDGKANPNWQLFEWLYYRGGAIAL